ncbi:MAG: cytoplasmic protein [Candidatus Limnocylindrales bacterium]
MTDELDGVIVASDHHKVLFENDEVRVIEVIIPAGDITPIHTHLAPTVQYVVSASHFIRRAADGSTMLDTRADSEFVLARVAFAPPAAAHTIENTGDGDLVVIGVELKHAGVG